VEILSKLQIQHAPPVHEPAIDPNAFEFRHEEFTGLEGGEVDAPMPATGDEEAPAQQPFVREGRKVGRNEPCPGGSGKKYKYCHGKLS